MGQPRWTGVDLWNLLNLPMAKLVGLYPEYTKDTLKGKKAYWKAKLRKGEIKMPENSPTGAEGGERGFEDILRLHNLSPELAQQFTDQGYHIGYIKNSEGEIEYTIPLPHARGRGSIDPESLGFVPATPARITPNKRKPVERPYKVIFAFSDAQIDYRRTDEGLEPIHDERALKVARMICASVRPDVIVNLGDTVDLAALSRFKADSDHFQRTLGPSFQRVHNYYAELRADNPDARIVEVDSNHNTRLKDFALKYTPQFYGLKKAGSTEEDWPVISYPNLANLNAVGVEWVSGYGAAEFVYGEEYDTPPIVFKHGRTMVSNGSTANKESKDNPEVNVVRGHGHRSEMHTRTNRAGNYLASVMVGALCRIDGAVPSYHSAVDDRGRVVNKNEDWQNGVLIIRDYQGNYEFQHIPIRQGKAYFNGEEYDGTS